MNLSPATPPPPLDKGYRIFQKLAFINLGISLFFTLIPSYSLFEWDLEWAILYFMGSHCVFVLALLIFSFIKHGIKIWKTDYRLSNLYVVTLAMMAFFMNRSFMGNDALAGIISVPMEWIIHLTFLGLVLETFFYRLPRGVQWLAMGLSGFGSVLALYYSVILAPMLQFGLLAILFFAIGLVIWSPVFMLGSQIRMLIRHQGNFYRWSWVIGALLPIGIGGVYGFHYFRFHQQVEESIALGSKTEWHMPSWVSIAQQLRERPFIRHFLSESMVSGAQNDIFFSFRPPTHDPLPALAIWLMGGSAIDSRDATPIMNSLTDWRHESEPRLWSDSGLETKSVETTVEIMPEYRMAYIEKKIDIHLDEAAVNGRRWIQREAIYTFHLPEGACATSLSLWINGKEEKARLDSKEKTSEAYRQIVGVESRDPSLATWLSGNRLVVRVFPVEVDMDRTFKIGFTIPLTYNEGKLSLTNPYFEGPTFRGAPETAEIRVLGPAPQGMKIPSGFEPIGSNLYTFKGDYEPQWGLELDAPPLSKGEFVRGNEKWRIEPLTVGEENFKASEWVLDVDREWSFDLFRQWVNWGNELGITVRVPNGEFEVVTAENQKRLWAHFAEYRFGMVPIQHLPHPEQTVIITRSTQFSPGWEDLSQGDNTISLVWDSVSSAYVYPSFAQDFLEFSQSHSPVRVFHFGEELSPYWRGLREVGAIHYTKGTPDEWMEYQRRGKFPMVLENEDRLANHTAQIWLVKDTLMDSTQRATAPNHLMRMHTYQAVMLHSSASVLAGQSSNKEWVHAARMAYVVTPQSSLVVLESQADYNRFDIRDDQGTLGNADQQNPNTLPDLFGGGQGGVPEPHEWVMIALLVLVAGWLYSKRFFRQSHG